MPVAASRLALRQSRLLIRRSAFRQNSTTSEAASKTKDAASSAASKASEGLSKVTSTAGPAIAGAVSGVGNALKRVGGRTGRMISFVESFELKFILPCMVAPITRLTSTALIPPTVYYSRVAIEVTKIVFQTQKMAPPNLATFQTYLQPLLASLRNPSALLSKLDPAPYFGRIRNMDRKQLAFVGVTAAEVIGFFSVGEMLGRWKIDRGIKLIASSYAQMDAFKLLTRSTKFKPDSKTGSLSSSTHLPSAGQASTPQLFPERQFTDADGTRGIKRKRNGDESISLSSDLAVPDFFGSGQPATASSTQPSKAKRNEKRTVDRENDLKQEGNNAPMSEAECKSILKAHKIKVTDLRSFPADEVSEAADGKKSKRKKAKRDQEPPAPLTRKQQKAALRLYPEPLTDFDQLRAKYLISRRLSENISHQGYTVPTEVQLGSLPLLLGGAPTSSRRIKPDETAKSLSEQEPDLLVVAPTGSGKTLSFMIPLINKIIKHHHANPGLKGILAIVLAPTKELVAQIVNEGRKLTAGTGVKITAMRKGMRVVEGAQNIRSLEEESEDDEDVVSSDGELHAIGGNKEKAIPLTRSDILVCTPLLLANALSQDEAGDMASLPSVKTLVLDEADVLLDPLFREQTLEVWKACTCPQLRVGLWSATMGSNIEELAKATIKARQQSLGLKDESFLIRLVVGLKDTAIPNISHKLVYAATEQGKLLGLRQLLHPTAASNSTTRLRPPFLVFTQTISRAVALHSELMYDIPPEAGGSSRIAVLHSELSDSRRSDVMAGFRKGEIWILITTDLLARGVDFKGINGVVNYDIPNSSAAYVHRVGRTGRAGRDGGVAVTFYTKEDISYVKNIANVISASEKLRGTEEGERIPKWLLDALPSLSKKDKEDLKRHGVKTRRPMATNDGSAAKKSRISTKSGFERRIENKRKGAIKGSQRRKAKEQSSEVDEGQDVWNGIED
ncbi:conserved hypothetical protein [Uncinocarpus reesii 1704]|uniref:ATP-dependent RNA helicase ROK1 n=1 Tax=Uncinocarpus reesii (strain UAMH 1704) TaxID=336963 RepID=C4JIN3_UNCRE|nr:uncharacterized protein UREG_02894 [Uncinocarpus reesii 1704]EEP78045.1 conserved hypothetical protein [Uncinocarpus reesii 1704]